MTYRSDPAWHAARAAYMAGDPYGDSTRSLRIRHHAAHRMFEIETAHEKRHP